MKLFIKKNIKIIISIFGIIGYLFQVISSYIFTVLGFACSVYAVIRIEYVKNAIIQYKRKENLLKAAEIIDKIIRIIELSGVKSNFGDNDGNTNLSELKIELRNIVSKLKPTTKIEMSEELYEKLETSYKGEINYQGTIEKVWKLKDLIEEYLQNEEEE